MNCIGALMKRTIDYFLLQWKQKKNHRSLLLRGARQVGKTHAVRTLGKTFEHFVEVNLELDEQAREIFTATLDVNRIILRLSQHFNKPIEAGKTLLFIDEIQSVPLAITALRYFYELHPGLHVVAAGSLLEFAIEQVGMPVGRVTFLYMYPMSFLEFMAALGSTGMVKMILDQGLQDEYPVLEATHQKLLEMVSTYLAIGGMPAAVNEWITTKMGRDVTGIHEGLLKTYQNDFDKYARKHQIKYLSLLFKKALEQLSCKFIFAHVGEYKKRELEPALELLVRAGLLHPVKRSAGQVIPIGAQASLDDFKLIFLDVGLTQALLKLNLTDWFLNPLTTMVNNGTIVEAFVGQELLAYADPISEEELYYWQRASKNSDAEIDYLVQLKGQVVPIEVKAGTSLHIKSMHLFLDAHTQATSYGIRCSGRQHEYTEKLHTYPLYAVAKPLIDNNEEMRNALLSLAE